LKYLGEPPLNRRKARYYGTTTLKARPISGSEHKDALQYEPNRLP
jgi:hypothetical protein